MNTVNGRESDLHVIFGTGPVGLTLADELLARGKKVRIVSRSGKAVVPVGVESRAADATDPDAVTELCRGAAAAYHCMNVAYAQQYEVIPQMQRAMIAGAGAAGAVLIVTDTLYLYGETHGKVITEDTPHAGTTRKGKMRAQVAADYLRAHQEGRIKVALGRAADFFGPRVFNSSLGDRVFPPALAGKAAQVVGDPGLPHSFSYMKDVARGLATLGERPEALGRDWLLPVAPAVSTREMVCLIGEAAGHPVRVQAIPKFVIQAMGLFDPQMREFVEMLYQYTEPQIVDSRRFEETFGWSATPLAEAIPATVAWFKASAARQASPVQARPAPPATARR